MKITLQKAATGPSDASIEFLFEGERLAGVEEDLFESGEIAGKALEITLLHLSAGSPARRLVVTGLGKRADFTLAGLRNAAGAAVRFIKGKSAKEVSVALGEDLRTAGHVEAVVKGAILANMEFDLHKSDKSDTKLLESLSFLLPDGVESGTWEAAIERGRILAEAQNFARMLGNEPPNILTPPALAEHARTVAGKFGLQHEVLDRERMTQLGFGALLGVSLGSAEPPVLIILRYTPEESAAVAGVNLGLVGKAVTFDSGGISIKPSESMDLMKYDMMGGAAVIAAMQAIAQLKPRVAVTAIIPSVENMLGPAAQRPGDIVKTLSGKTVEMLNTDAEGRMILADAMTYAIRIGCTHLVDAATLTGAVVGALGHTFTGVFGDYDELRDKWMAAAADEGEKMWRLPMDGDFKERIKGNYADLLNIGGRWGGASIAANFLKEFAESTPWLHLDIAGTAWLDEAKPWMAKGPTGSPARSFARLAMNWV